MASRSPRLCAGIEPAYPQQEELNAEDASQELRDAVRDFLERAKAWTEEGQKRKEKM